MTALSMLLAAGGISAQAAVKVDSLYEVLDNYSSITFLYDDWVVDSTQYTINGTDTTYTWIPDSTVDNHEDTEDVLYGNYVSYTVASHKFVSTWGTNNVGANNAVQYSLQTAIDISGYNKIVVELDSLAGDSFEIKLCSETGSSYWGGVSLGTQTKNSYSYKYTIEIPDSIKSQLSNRVGTFVLLMSGWNWTDCTLDLKSVRFEHSSTTTLDYEEIDYSAGRCVSGTEASVDSTYMKITFGDNRTSYWGWDISDVYTPNYKYLVVVPRIPYCGESGYESELGTGAASNIQYSVSDGTNEIGNWDYSFAYGWWQRRRACVLDLDSGEVYNTNTDYTKISANTVTEGDTTWTWKSWLPGADLQVLKMCCQDDSGSYEISAIYFTNEQPTYNNVAWGGASNWDYSREATTMGTYGTVCLPYASAICGARAYDVVGYGTDDSGNPSELYLQEVYGVLEAGKAYVYKTVATTYDTQEGYVTFTKAGANTVSGATTGNALVGTLEESGVNVDDSCYILFADSVMEEGGSDSTAVYKWGKGTGNTVAQYRAYLDLSVFEKSTDTTEAKANGWISMSLAYDGDDETTGIKEIVSEEENTIDDDVIYNLSGVRVTNPQKGIYIKNGKKYIIK